MLTIHYRVRYEGICLSGGSVDRVERGIGTEIISVQARNINSGYSKALKVAKQPLGNGDVREIGSIEFWQSA